MGTILVFIIILSLLVFVHELGHFLMAKKMGMKVEEFGFGFPPRLFGLTRGETTYSINSIPLGGFVRIKGESGEHRDHPDSFSSKSALARFGVLVAGVAMNLLLAAVLLSVGFMIGLPGIVDESLPSSAHVRDRHLMIMNVLADSPAAKAGIQAGDILLNIDAQTFTTTQQARDYIASKASEPMTVLVEDQQHVSHQSELVVQSLPSTGTIGLGVGLVQTGLISYPFLDAVIQGIGQTISLTGEILKAFGGIVKSLIGGHGVGVDLSGPVGIAVMTGQVAALGFVYLLQFTALLSINLAVINVLPFPALDGGRILFLLIEKWRGRAVDERVETAAHNLGFLLLMVLVLLVTYKDFATYGGEIIKAFQSLT
ncbi:RIP metalloprotease RseP [Candidatus Uhrbacteria bacterium]|nr:RIP metalloprotease RseP [Candidatus Uhrbacteria bacterium]